MARFIYDNPIAQGGFGDVFHGVDTSTGQEVAIKFLREVRSEDARRRFAREVKQMQSNSHQRIMRVIYAEPNAARPFYVMPFFQYGTVTRYAGRLTFEQVRQLTADVVEAIEQTHRNNALHRDIKPDNIMLGGDWSGTLTDFGLGNDARFTVHLTMNACGTPGYMAPEFFRNGTASQSSDMFAVGATLFHLITGVHPNGLTVLDPSAYRSDVPADLRELVLDLTSDRPYARPNAEGVLVRLGRREQSNAGAGTGVAIGFGLGFLALLWLIGGSRNK